MRKAQGTSIQTIGAIVLVVLVVVALSVFFFSSLSKQGGVLGSTSNQTVGNLNKKLNTGICGLGDNVCGDGLCCPPEDSTSCSSDCT